jgi:predicted nucleic acid-binding protein
MIFMDTSVLVCASTPSDPRYDACVELLRTADSARRNLRIPQLLRSFSQC